MNFDPLKKIPIGNLGMFAFVLPTLLTSVDKILHYGVSDSTMSMIYCGGIIQLICGCIQLLTGETLGASVFIPFGASWLAGVEAHGSTPPLSNFSMGSVNLVIGAFVVVKTVTECINRESILHIIFMIFVALFCLMSGVVSYIDITECEIVSIINGVVGIICSALGVIYGVISQLNIFVGRDVITLCYPKRKKAE